MKKYKIFKFKYICLIAAAALIMAAAACTDRHVARAPQAPTDYITEDLTESYASIRREDASEGYEKTAPDGTWGGSQEGSADGTAQSPHASAAEAAEYNAAQAADSDTVIITERLFIAQINDIFFNFEDYDGKTVVVEGMYSVFESMLSDKRSPVVYRLGPGCCSNDAWAGFLLKMDVEKYSHLQENDWLRVSGKPILEVTPEGYTNLYLEVDTLEVLTERGKETVAM